MQIGLATKGSTTRRAGLGLTALGWCLLAAGNACAADSDSLTPTFFLTATGGYSVYKSEMVQSNDTSTTIGYGFGVYAGSQRSVGMFVKRETSEFTFALNGSTIAVDWQDTHLRYRWGPVYLGGVIANSTWKVAAPPDDDADGLLDQEATPEDYIDITSTGYGANLGTRIPVSRSGSVYLDTTYATAATVQQRPLEDETGEPVDRTVTLGPRLEVDMGGTIGIARNWLEAQCGFKYRTYQVTVDDVPFVEGHNTTYVGFTAGWTF